MLQSKDSFGMQDTHKMVERNQHTAFSMALHWEVRYNLGTSDRTSSLKVWERAISEYTVQVTQRKCYDSVAKKLDV